MRRRALVDELVALLEEALRPGEPARRQTGALGRRFWYFPDGRPIRIVGTRLSAARLKSIGYADSWHPNYIEALRNADIDASAAARMVRFVR